MHIDNDVLEALDEYHHRSLMMQKWLYDKTISHTVEAARKIVDDDLIFHVPIYDMLDRRFAAFSSFPEALKHKEKDPKGHGHKYKHHKVDHQFDWFMLLYLFRLCGSGINYVPGDHGFGNFWICESIKQGKYTYQEWFEDLPQKQFSNNKGYLLPQFSIGLRNYILKHSYDLVHHIYNHVSKHRRSIIDVVDYGNEYLKKLGFRKQTFVLSAFAADLAEYFPDLVDPWSMIHAGTNAKKCIKLLFGKCSDHKAIEFLSKRYNSHPYSVEDSRLCDPIRYFREYQSRFHIEANQGKVYSNNTILKKKWNKSKYQDFLLRLQK